MSVSVPARAQTGLYCLLAVALYSSFGFLLDGIKIERKAEEGGSPTSAYVRRFEKLRQELPPEIRRLGYLTDMPRDPGDVEFHLTQYSLVPRVLQKADPDKKLKYFVGNMVKPATPEFLAAHGVRQVNDYGLGVVLFERKADGQ